MQDLPPAPTTLRCSQHGGGHYGCRYFAKGETASTLRVCGRSPSSTANFPEVCHRRDPMYSAAGDCVQIAFTMEMHADHRRQSSAVAALLTTCHQRTCYCLSFTDSFNFVIYNDSIKLRSVYFHVCFTDFRSRRAALYLHHHR